MTVQEFRDRCATGETVVFGSEVQKKFDEYMQEALKITRKLVKRVQELEEAKKEKEEAST